MQMNLVSNRYQLVIGLDSLYTVSIYYLLPNRSYYIADQ